MLNSLLFIGGIGLPELFIVFFFLFVPAVLWLWAIIDLLKSTFKDSSNKLIWAIIIIFIPILGSILYLLIGRGQKVKTDYQ